MNSFVHQTTTDLRLRTRGAESWTEDDLESIGVRHRSESSTVDWYPRVGTVDEVICDFWEAHDKRGSSETVGSALGALVSTSGFVTKYRRDSEEESSMTMWRDETDDTGDELCMKRLWTLDRLVRRAGKVEATGPYVSAASESSYPARREV